MSEVFVEVRMARKRMASDGNTLWQERRQRPGDSTQEGVQLGVGTFKNQMCAKSLACCEGSDVY